MNVQLNGFGNFYSFVHSGSIIIVGLKVIFFVVLIVCRFDLTGSKVVLGIFKPVRSTGVHSFALMSVTLEIDICFHGQSC